MSKLSVMRSRASGLRRISFFFFSVSLYILIKLVIVSRVDDRQSGADAVLEAGVVLNPSVATGVSSELTPYTDNPFGNLFSSGPNCTSPYLDAPPYVTAAGCAGSNARFCEQLTCRNLLIGSNSKVYDVAKEFMDQHKKTFLSDEQIGNAAEDCDRFKRSRAYHAKPLAGDDPSFRIAFNILVHTNIHQMERLLRAIYRPHHSYCIHVDGKSPQSFIDNVRKIANCFDNVFVASKLEKIVYAGFTRLKADLNCMEDHVRRSAVPWKYLINTAAQSFPLQTPEDMVRILKIYNGSNDIEGIHGRRVIRFRFELEWQERMDTMTVNQTGRSHKSPPHDLDIVRGSAFGVFSREFVEFILTDKRSLDLMEWSKKTYSPDEHFWSTLHHTYTNPHLHTPGGFSGPPNDKPWLAVFVKWGLPSNCHGRFVRGVCILGVADLPDLVKRRELFVNKFYEDFQPLGLDCLEAWIRHREQCPTTALNLDFYKSLPFVKRF